MPDVQEVFRLATNKVKPDPDALERQVRRQRAEVRKSRVRAYVAVAAVLVVLGVAIFALSRVVGRNDVTSDHNGPQPTQPYTFEPGPLLSTADPQTAAIVDPHGNQTSVIPNVPVQAFATSVSPDGSTMAFIDAPKELMYNQVAVMNTNGTDVRFVPTPGIIVYGVAMSPDGSQIAFEGEANNNDDIYVVNTDGSGLMKLTDDPATDQFPAWSPDGTTIVYDNAGKHEQVSDPQFSKTSEIYAVPADGGTPTQITHNKGYDAAPSFSPNGKTIVDESFRGIAMMHANGTGYHQFVNMGGFTPHYSPNGKTVAFSNFTGRWHPDVQLGGNYSPSSALCLLATADVKTGRVTKLANVGMATDYNTPQWIDSQHILVMRVPAHAPK